MATKSSAENKQYFTNIMIVDWSIAIIQKSDSKDTGSY